MRPVTRTTPSIVALIALLSLSTPGIGQQSGPVLLRLNLQPGMSYRMSTTTEMDIAQTVMGQSQDSHQAGEMVTLAEVLSVDGDGVSKVRTTYESTRVVQETPMGRTEYDSTDPPSTLSQEARPYAFMVGESFTMQVAPGGSITDVEGMEDYLPRLIEEMDIPPGPMRDQIEESLEDQFGGDGMADMMRQAMTLFHREPVVVGESWTSSASIERPFPSQMETTWTLRERRAGIAYLDVTIVTVSDGTMDMGPMVMTYDLSGEMTGTVEIDEATGLTLRSRAEGGSSGTVTMTGPMGDVAMPMTMKLVTTSELLSRN